MVAVVTSPSTASTGCWSRRRRRTGVDSNGNGVPDEAAGHGTFVAGAVALVAPHARLLAYRVLDSDGLGTTYDAAGAVTAAADAGAKVINLSVGTPGGVMSRLCSAPSTS
jgi:subtilisin family serine protease